ncbi:MAG TPA: enolase C-terminal domain-like protein [Elusimicrobiota bacterium]|nr:enolase C-terminal domain-like protein [Elusimicrobiota bacterium]
MQEKFRLSVLRVVPVRWPLRRPFVTSLGAKSYSDNVRVMARLSGGATGYGEASSSLAMPFQTAANMSAALRRLFHSLRGSDARDIEKIVSAAWRLEGKYPTAVAAFETALWDALSRALGMPFSVLWGGASTTIETLMSVSAVDPEEVSARVRAGRRRGFRLFKLKLNGHEPPERDRARLRAAHRACPRGRFLADANQSYSPENLSAFLAAARRDGLSVEVLEEPFKKRSWAALASVRATVRTPLLLDESVQTPADARRAARGRLARGVNVKLAKSGLLRGHHILREFWGEDERFRRSAASPRPLFMIGCMAESKLGLAASVHWACGLGVFDYADLDSDLLLKPTPCRGGYVRRGPTLSLPRPLPPGLGVEPA